MSMLTGRDIAMMEQDVRDIIYGWQTRIKILAPLPAESQPNWSALLHEYNGEIHYTLYDNVVAERKDIQDKNTHDLNIEGGAGNKDDGRLIFTVSDLYTFVDIDCQIIYDGLRYKVDMLKERIGETLILISKITGSDEKWANTPDVVIDCENTSGGK